MGDFERDTRVSAVAEGSRELRAELSPEWKIWAPNGGYLAAIALRAAGQFARIPRPASISAHILAVAEFAEVRLTVDVLRSGRTAESLRVGMWQGEKQILEALVRTAREGPGYEHDAAPMPPVPPPAACTNSHDMHSTVPFWSNLEPRTPWPERRAEGRRVHEPVWTEWLRFVPRSTFDDPFLDAGRSLVLIDTLSFPATVQAHLEFSFIAPNLDVTAWFHRLEPQSAWLLVQHRAQIAAHGLVGTVADVWSESGRLLASGGAQLLCQPVSR